MTAYFGIDAGYASTGIAVIENKAVTTWLWESKPDKTVHKSLSDINRLTDYAEFIYGIFKAYTDRDVVVTLENFTAVRPGLAWNAIKTIMINSITIAIAHLFKFKVQFTSPQAVHQYVKGGGKADTALFVEQAYGYTAGEFCKSKREHPIDAVAIAHLGIVGGKWVNC